MAGFCVDRIPHPLCAAIARAAMQRAAMQRASFKGYSYVHINLREALTMALILDATRRANNKQKTILKSMMLYR